MLNRWRAALQRYDNINSPLDADIQIYETLFDDHSINRFGIREDGGGWGDEEYEGDEDYDEEYV
jgi:hypothetical protein